MEAVKDKTHLIPKSGNAERQDSAKPAPSQLLTRKC